MSGMKVSSDASDLGHSHAHNGDSEPSISNTIEVKYEYLSNLDPKYIDGPLFLISHSASSENFVINECNYQEGKIKLLHLSTLSISDRRQCSMCNCNFVDREQQIEHYKLDWHRFNLKRNLNHLESITETQFNEMMNNQSDVSSISASESGNSSDSDVSEQRGDSENVGDAMNKLVPSIKPVALKEVGSNHSQRDNDQRKCKFYFKNSTGDILSIQRCILHGKYDIPECENDFISKVKSVFHNLIWGIILIGGGHFAAGIFDKDQILKHKTFHRYTVRAKQGSTQFQRDMKHGGSHSKSAGASLRRYNEAALVHEIQLLLSSWQDTLSQCSTIFYRAPSFNKTILFSGKSPPFQKNDNRLRNIPFATRRATLREIKRVHQCLKTIEIIPVGNALNCQISSYFKIPGKVVDKQGFVQTPADANNVQNSRIKLPKAHKRKNKKIKSEEKDLPSTIKHQSDPCLKLYTDDEQELLFNHLYTVCKSGKFKDLNDLLSQIPNDSVPGVINRQFGNTQSTLLHVASKDGANHLVKCLLHHGADPTILNNQQQPPYVLAKDIDTKSLFQEFRKEFPEKYNYEFSKIQDLETKEKRKKVKLKNNTIRKEGKMEENISVKNPNAVPCDFCEVDISLKVPFECYNLKFCSTDCVRKFRTRQVRPK